MNPMTYRYQTLLGRISRISGYHGSVSVKLEKYFLNNIPEMEWVFLEIDGRPVPFFVSHSEYSGGDTLILKFEGYNTYEKVCEFNGCSVFLTTIHEDFAPAHNTESVSGFRVILRNKKLIGTVKEIVQNPGHDLLKIMSPEEKEILIPFHEDFILNIEMKLRIISVELPEGLTEIN
jgi:16S rRNA processing protein RimM